MQSDTHRPSCLVLAAKRVGLECLRSMIEDSKDDIRAVLVGSENDHDILALARDAGLDASVYGAFALAGLRDSGGRIDWLVNLWCPHILKPEILSLATRRLNVHPGLVPHCRGNDTAAWALRLRLPAGVSLIEMSPGIDGGGVYAQRQVHYGPAERGRGLHDKLQDAAIALFRAEWPGVRNKLDPPPLQDSGGSYFTRKMTEQDRVRPGSDRFTLDELVNWSQAHDFSPGTTAEVRASDGRSFRVKVEEIDDE